MNDLPGGQIISEGTRTSRPAAKSEPEILPDRVDTPAHRIVHRNRPAPRPRGLAGPFVGSVDTHLAAQPRHRRREIEIVDGRVVDDQGIARGVYARGERPDDVFPVTDI